MSSIEDLYKKIKEKLNKKEEIDAKLDDFVTEYWRQATIIVGVSLPSLYLVSRFIIGKRFKTAAHIPPEIFEKSKFIKGRVVTVGDSDNFRLYHTPGFGWGYLRKIPETRKGLQNETISIRIAGVDAPEGAHFGMPAQPFSAEAKEYLKKLVLYKNVSVQLLSRDQYSRIVAMVYVRNPPFYFKKNVSIEMLKQGLASLYIAKGAQYAGLLEKMQKIESRAKYLKKGIWSQNHYISPGDHKQKYLGGGK